MSMYISVLGEGKLIFWEKNKRECKCCMCACELKSGEGYKFKKAIYSRLKSGFVCNKCVADYLKTNEEWHWNSFIGCLFPAIMETIHRHKGSDLAEVWLEAGEKGFENYLDKR